MLHGLKRSIDMQADSEMVKERILKTRVTTTKEWSKWDWDIIVELLEDSLTNPARLAEAIKGKFVRRICGFYRCSTDEKGFFAHLPWMPDHVPYLQPACQLHALLLVHPEGQKYLREDRRGKLLPEIAACIDLEVQAETRAMAARLEQRTIDAASGGSGRHGESPSQANPGGHRIFSPKDTETSMVREYFTLIGLMSSFSFGRDELERTGVFKSLGELKNAPVHDYLRRLVLANLDYSTQGPARNLLQMWITEGSTDFRLYATCLLRALLRADVTDFAEWGVEVLVTQLYMEQQVAEVALSVLEEAAKQPQYLQAIIRARPQLVQLAKTHPNAMNLLIRFLALPEGLAFLSQDLDWVNPALKSWRSTKHVQYVGRVEDKLRRGLLRNSSQFSGEQLGYPQALPIPVRVPGNDCYGAGGHYFSGEAGVGGGSGNPNGFDGGGGGVDGSAGGSADRSTERWSMEWLFRMPWRLHAQVGTFEGGGSGASRFVPLREVVTDTFVDASRLRPERHHEDGSESGYAVRLKGVVVRQGNPRVLKVAPTETLRVALFLGALPVNPENGETEPSPLSNGGFIYSQSNSSSSMSFESRARGRTRADTAGQDDAMMAAMADDVASRVPSEEENNRNPNIWSYCKPSDRTGQSGGLEVVICPSKQRASWNFQAESADDKEKVLCGSCVWLIIYLWANIYFTSSHLTPTVALTSSNCTSPNFHKVSNAAAKKSTCSRERCFFARCCEQPSAFHTHAYNRTRVPCTHSFLRPHICSPRSSIGRDRHLSAISAALLTVAAVASMGVGCSSCTQSRWG
jgi:hypothetical protein